MDYKELLITIGLMIIISIVYVLIRKFIIWTIKDEQKFLKKKGCLGFDNKDIKSKSDIPIFKLTFVYILFMVLLIIYIFKLIVDSQ